VRIDVTDLPRTDDTHLLDTFVHAHPDGTGPDLPDADPTDGIEPAYRDDDLAAALAGGAPRRWWNRGTLVLGACALLLAGFLGGVLVEQHWGTTAGANRAAATRGAAGLSGFAGGAGRGAGTVGGGQGAPGSAGTASSAPAATTGTVKLVDGTTIYVQTPNGDVITVRTNAKTSVRTSRASKIGDVRAGQTVTVQGPAATDGTVTATSVTAAGQ
jgi:hypothetical protein